jgi:hypothetical protein
MRIDVPTALQQLLGLPAIIDTKTMTESEVGALYDELDRAGETGFALVKTDDRGKYQLAINAITIDLCQALIDEDYRAPEEVKERESTTTTSSPPPSSSSSSSAPAKKPANLHTGKVKFLRGNFGKAVHDQMHFAPTTAKARHGVWGTKDLGQVKTWVGQALDSIFKNDAYLVKSKKGQKAGAFIYLVNMGEEVGYLSGSSVTGKPSATHIEVFMDKKGMTTSAFPSSPDGF